MLSATRQLLAHLGELETLQKTGESPTPAEIRYLFKLRADAQAEVEAITPADLQTEIDPAPAPVLDDFSQVIAADILRPRDARKALDITDDVTVDDLPSDDPIRRIHDSLQREIQERRTATPRRPQVRALVHWHRISRRDACYTTAAPRSGAKRTTVAARVTCPACAARVAAATTRKPRARRSA